MNKSEFQKAFKADYPKAKLRYSGKKRAYYVHNFSFSQCAEWWATDMAVRYKQRLVLI